jgi:glycosyltransferase involved in cell wall biosynthesis
MRLLFFFTFFSFVLTNSPLFAYQKAKIVALVMVRNEEHIIEQCLRALTYYVDSIIVLDDASEDSTPEIVKGLAGQLPIECLMRNNKSAWEYRTEMYNKQRLLNEGRRVGGTHFIIIDADEMFTAQCKKNNLLRKKILALKPGQALSFQMTHLWRGFDYYRDDESRWSPQNCWCGCIFRDDGKADYSQNNKKSFSGFIHVNRLPVNRINQELDEFVQDLDYHLMHFRFVNWRNIIIKRAWYMCLELIRSHENLSLIQPQRGAPHINVFYTVIEDFNEKNMKLKKVDPHWFDYSFFDQNCFMRDIQWRKNQVLSWFDQYGKDFFKYLDIWHIDWDR